MDLRIIKLFQELDELEEEYKKKIIEQIVFQREIPYEYDGTNSWVTDYLVPENCIEVGVPEEPHMLRIRTDNGMFNTPSGLRKELLEITIENFCRILARKKLRMDERLEEIQRGENNDQN